MQNGRGYLKVLDLRWLTPVIEPRSCSASCSKDGSSRLMAVQVNLQYMFVGVLLIDRSAWEHCAKSPRLFGTCTPLV
jgi:hypothetical protein